MMRSCQFLRLTTLVAAAAAFGCGRSDGGRSPSKSADAEVRASEALALVADDAEKIVIDVQAPDPELTQVTLDARPYTRLRLAGFRAEIAPGQPEVPSRTAFLIVPAGMSLRYEVVSEDKAAPTVLAADLAFLERNPVHNGKENLVSQDVASYARIYGEEAVEILDVSWAGSDRLATVKLSPVRYDAARREMTLRRSFKVHFSFVRAHDSFASRAPVGGPSGVARFVALNGEARPRPPMAAAAVDLIIAHASHRATLSRYVAFKRSRGRTVREHYVEGRTAAQIQALIRQEYAGTAPPTQTLLVGNIDQIPAWRGTGDNAWTDFNYQTLDAGEVPDLSLGRIPAHDAAELDAFLDKAMARETGGNNTDDILLTAGRDVSLGCPASVTQVGENIQPAARSVRVIQKYRSEDATTDEVFAAYNASPNVVVYDGHGDQQGMQEIPLVIDNLSRLTNGSFPIFFDIACLNASWSGGANSRNFAESILLQPGAGAAGILASGGSGYGHDFFQSMGELMATARQNLGRGDGLLNEVGQVVLAAKIRHGREDRTFWNYYGDPATSVWEAGR